MDCGSICAVINVRNNELADSEYAYSYRTGSHAVRPNVKSDTEWNGMASAIRHDDGNCKDEFDSHWRLFFLFT